MRKYLFIALAVLPMLAVSGVGAAKPKGVANLVGAYSDWSKKLVNSKAFAKKTVLLEVLDQKKSTTVGALLSTVDAVLSPAQHNIFVAPLILAEHQNVNYATVEVDGAVVKNVGLRPQPPSEQVGVAALVLSFKGDTTLPAQVLANLQSQ